VAALQQEARNEAVSVQRSVNSSSPDGFKNSRAFFDLTGIRGTNQEADFLT